MIGSRHSRHTGIRRTGLLLMSCLLMAAALLIVLLNTEGSPLHLGTHRLGGSFELASASLGVLIVSITGWWAHHRGRFDLFEPPVWFSLNAYGQVVFNIWLLQRDESFNSYVSSMMAESAPAAAVVVIGAGLVAFWVGYMAAGRFFGSQPRLVQHVPGEPRWRLIVGIWLGAILLEALAVVGGATGYLPLVSSVWISYLAFVGRVGDLTTFALLLYHFRRPRTLGWLWLLAMATTEVFLGLVAGTKSSVFVLLYAIMAIYYVRRRLSVRWLAAGFLALMLVVPTVNTFRTNLFAAGFDRTAGAGFGDRVPILLSSLGDTLTNPLSSLAIETRETFEQRQGSIMEITVAMMTVHPNLRPFVGPDMLDYLAQQLIPRVFWPSKPAGQPGLYLILSSYLGVPDHSFATPGQFADAYRAGGWLLVFFWCCLLGAFMAWLYARGPGTGGVLNTAFYLLMLTSLVTYDSHVTRTILETLKFGLLLWLASNYLLVKAARHGRRVDSGSVLSGTVPPREPGQTNAMEG